MPNFAGLYVGMDFVDLVVLASAKGNPQIVKSARTFLFDEAPTIGQKDKFKAMPAAIKKAFDSLKLNVGGLNFGLPQDEVMVRHFKMPSIPIGERSSAMKFEAQKYLPFKLEDTISDFYVTQESRTTRDMGVLFAAVNKEVINKYLPLFKEQGVKVNVLDIASIALLRVLSAAKKLVQDQTQLVVYLEKNVKASVIIARDRNVYLAREIGFSISKSALLENIVSNIRLSIDYYKRETKEVVIREIILCGEGELSEFGIYLKENISGIPVTIFNLKDEFLGLNEVSRKQLIAIGLALAHFEKPRPKINLLATAARGAFLKGTKAYRPLVIEGVALFVILAMTQIIANSNLDAAKKRVARIRDQKATAAKGVRPDTPGEELLMMEARLKSQIEFLKNLAGENRFFLTKKLNTLGAVLPQGAWLESFQFTDEVDKQRGLDIKGMIYSEEKNEARIADKMFSDMKREQGFYLGFEDIKLSSLEKVSAYNKEVLAFMVKCVGMPLRSSDLFGEK